MQLKFLEKNCITFLREHVAANENFPDESILTYDRCRCGVDQEEKSEAKKLHLHQDDPHLVSTCSGLFVSRWSTVVMVLPTITI